MRKSIFIIVPACCSIWLFSFFMRPLNTPAEKIKSYYFDSFKVLQQQLNTLRAAVVTNQGQAAIQQHFLQSRLAYKKLELILEFYFEGDVERFNGLAIPFIEEEDPIAYQEPQGFQMIETFIYPQYDSSNKPALLLYIDKLSTVASGIGNNTALFEPQKLLPDAVMEEFYRILALGITGFDSPIAQLSLPETTTALSTIAFIAQSYRTEWRSKDVQNYDRLVQLLGGASAYLSKYNDFNSFNRMEFITRYLNPLCDAMGSIKRKGNYPEHPTHYTLIKKNGSLFAAASLDRNRYLYDDTVTAAKALLGRKIFYEPMLSANNKRSCANCHQPAKAFTDGLPKALQLDEHSTLPRNTPTLWNASLQMNLFYDSRHVRLDDVVLEVLANKHEMNTGAAEAVKRLLESGSYKKLFSVAYGAGGITEKNLANAIAAYIKTLISYNSRFDQYMRGKKNSMTADEINGFNLFAGKAKCATCHYIPLFNGSKPPTYYYQESEVIGVPASTDTLHPVLDADSGRIHTLKLDFFNHTFKTPTLRNISLTAPYMHNGVYKTLEEVIDFYDKGGGQGLGLQVPNQTLPAEKLLLSKTEKKQLIAFLATLTDTSSRKAVMP